MASGLVTHSLEQCCIIFLVKEKVKPAKIHCRLNAQDVEEALSCASVCDWHSNFFESHKEISYLHSANSCIQCEHLLHQKADFEKQANYNL
jgi:hypothetical protein